jgi:hypothetical protein
MLSYLFFLPKIIVKTLIRSQKNFRIFFVALKVYIPQQRLGPLIKVFHLFPQPKSPDPNYGSDCFKSNFFANWIKFGETGNNILDSKENYLNALHI